MPLGAGQKPHLVTVQNVTRTAEASGGFAESWANASPATEWIALDRSGVTEGAQGNVERAPVRYVATLRYRSDVTEDTRFVYQSRNLYVIQAPGFQDRHHDMQVVVEERR